MAKFEFAGINVFSDSISDEKELEAYAKYAVEREGDNLAGITVTLINDDEVDIAYMLKDVVPFERIRRLTGYLVGTLDRWNDAKRAEEHDRVKHTL